MGISQFILTFFFNLKNLTFDYIFISFITHLKYMNQEIEIKNDPLYYYYGKDGLKYHTPNFNLAYVRAIAHGTNEVYLEKKV